MPEWAWILTVYGGAWLLIWLVAWVCERGERGGRGGMP